MKRQSSERRLGNSRNFNKKARLTQPSTASTHTDIISQDSIFESIPTSKDYELITKTKIENTTISETPKNVTVTKDQKPGDKRIAQGFTIQISEEVDQRKVCWTEKWKPKNTKEIIGNGTAITKAKLWLENYKKNLQDVKPVLVLCGPCGVGKSILPYILAEEVGYEVEEYSTISGRAKISKSNFIKEAVLVSRIKNTYDKKPLLILIDQGDIIGTASHYSDLVEQLLSERGSKEYKSKTKKKGNEQIKISVRKKRPAPIIITVNDFNEKLNPLKRKGKSNSKTKSDYMFIELLYMNQLNPSDITKRLQYICSKEKIVPSCLDLISDSCNGDMRRAIGMLELSCTFLGSKDKLESRIIGILKGELSRTDETIKQLIKEGISILQNSYDQEKIQYLISNFEVNLKLKWIRYGKSGKYECSEKDRNIAGALEYLRQLEQPEKKEMIALEVDKVCTLFKPMEYNPRVEKTVEKLFETKMSIEEMKEESDYCSNRSLMLALIPENAYRAVMTSHFKTEEDQVKALNNVADSLSNADLIRTTLLDPVTEETSPIFQEVYELFAFQLPIYYSKGANQMVKLPKLDKEQYRCVSWQHMSSYENTIREAFHMQSQIRLPDLPLVAKLFANLFASWNIRQSEKADLGKYYKRLLYGENLDDPENSVMGHLRKWTKVFDIVSRDERGNLLKDPYFSYQITEDSFHLENTLLLVLFFRNQKLEKLLKKQKKEAEKPLDLNQAKEEDVILKEFEERKKDFAKMLICLGFTDKIFKKMKTLCLDDSESYQLWIDWEPTFDKSFETLLQKFLKHASDVGNLLQ